MVSISLNMNLCLFRMEIYVNLILYFGQCVLDFRPLGITRGKEVVIEVAVEIVVEAAE